jgi:hypothetical protein
MNATRRAGLRVLTLALLLAAAAGGASATAPGVMTYQGRIKEGGFPVTGVRSVDIFLCPGAATLQSGCYDTGAQSVSVSNGLFRTTFTALSGTPPSGVDWESGQWYLEVDVAGVPFTPRELLAAAPFAVYASSAATLVPNPGSSSVSIAAPVVLTDGGFSVGGSTFVVAGGKVGVGTASPGAALEVSGDLWIGGSGHLRTKGSAPNAGAGCGTGASVSGGDVAGRVTLGTSPSITCTLAFNAAWSPNAPVCHFTNESQLQALLVNSISTVSVTFGPGAALTAGDVISYLCIGY